MDVVEIARAAEAADGVAPLDEATLLTLRHRASDVTVWGDERGAGLLVGSELSLVVLPEHRGSGRGTLLLDSAPLPGGVLTAWSHGDHPAAAALAASHGWERARELWVMRRPSSGLSAVPPPASDVTVRGFRPGDEAELLRVNAAAFAHHPEQGSLSRADLKERMAEPWYEPEGLIEAWSANTLLGFHWTKRHSDSLGEVYVVGIDPAAQGRGLGKLLTAAGLAHLADAGVAEIHLYVESDNAPAVALYAGLGFTHAPADTHVQYVRH